MNPKLTIELLPSGEYFIHDGEIEILIPASRADDVIEQANDFMLAIQRIQRSIEVENI